MATHLVGATGNIGKRVVEKGGENINVISRFELKLDQRPLYYNFDAKTIGGTAIKEGDVIIFAAAISEPSVVSAQFQKALAVNVESTGEFIETALGKGCKVLFLSSDAVYGEVETGFDESHPTNPKGAYAEMKAVVEKRFEGNPSFKALRLSYNFHKMIGLQHTYASVQKMEWKLKSFTLLQELWFIEMILLMLYLTLLQIGISQMVSI